MKEVRNKHLLIVGAQKSGTSSLHKYLSHHPEIISGRNKELRFFTAWDCFNQGYNWYAAQFKGNVFQQMKRLFFDKEVPYLIDSTPAYLYHAKVPELIKTTLGGRVKIIILLRDPVQRAYSAYQMFRRFYMNPRKYQKVGRLKLISGSSKLRDLLLDVPSFPTFQEVLDMEYKWIVQGNNEIIEPSFIRRGFYADQIKRYYAHFDDDQIKIIDHHDLKANTRYVVNEILNWLNLDNKRVLNKNLTTQYNTSQHLENIGKKEELFLKNIYEKPNLKLFKLLGKNLDWD